MFSDQSPAESSVTLPELNTVICLGLAKQITYNEMSHRQMLEPVWISRASATQRAGRTGRIAPGTVIRLYSRECYHHHMLPFEPGELCRIPLDSVILTLKDMMGNEELVTNVLQDCIEPPNLSTIDRSFQVSRESNMNLCL
jgi:HrpA-like RNA helicase